MFHPEHRLPPGRFLREGRAFIERKNHEDAQDDFGRGLYRGYRGVAMAQSGGGSGAGADVNPDRVNKGADTESDGPGCEAVGG